MLTFLVWMEPHGAKAGSTILLPPHLHGEGFPLEVTNGDVSTVLLALREKVGQKLHRQLDWAQRIGEAPAFGDEGVGDPEKAVQNVLPLLCFCSLVQRQHGATIGVVELLHAAYFIRNQKANRPFLLLVQEREWNHLGAVE